MGLIKAAIGAAGGVAADQWKEFFYCEALPADVLAVKGRKKASRRSSNKHGDENIITNGSLIAVADDGSLVGGFDVCCFSGRWDVCFPLFCGRVCHACRYREFYPGFFAGTGDVNDNEKEEGGMI